MRITIFAALVSLALLVPSNNEAAAQSMDEIVSSPETIVPASYEALHREPGEDFDWELFRHFLLPDAKLYPNSEQTGGTHRAFTRDAFIAWVDSVTAATAPIGSPQDMGFIEEQIWSEVNRYGDVAHVLSTYQKRFPGQDEILGRGVNSFQLVFRDGRWWIVSVVWDEESGAGPIPSKYMPE